jgi:hypothetical protein
VATFEDWFYEIENFGLRAERFYCDLDNYATQDLSLESRQVIDKAIVSWLRAAYNVGREHALESLRDDGK